MDVPRFECRMVARGTERLPQHLRLGVIASVQGNERLLQAVGCRARGISLGVGAAGVSQECQ